MGSVDYTFESLLNHKIQAVSTAHWCEGNSISVVKYNTWLTEIQGQTKLEFCESLLVYLEFAYITHVVNDRILFKLGECQANSLVHSMKLPC